MIRTIITFLALICVAHSAPSIRVESILAETKPEIDGVLDESVWASAHWYGGFHVLGSESKPDVATEFAVSYNQDYLFIAVRSSEPSGLIKAQAMERDSHGIYRDDSVEVFIAPGAQRGEYYQFQVNAVGVVGDAVARQSGTVRDSAWRSYLEAATVRGAAGWELEMAIPLADLELSEVEGTEWGINIARIRRGGGNELQTFVPLVSSFHQPSQFATLELPGLGFEERRFELTEMSSFSVYRENERMQVQSKVNVDNRSTRLQPVLLQVYFHERPDFSPEERSDILNPASSRNYDLKLELPRLGRQYIVLELTDRREPDRPLVRRIREVNLTFNPLEVVLHEPAYMASIFPSQSIASIEGILKIAFSETELSRFQGRVALWSDSESEELLSEMTLDSLTPETAFNLPLPEMVEGAYSLRVDLVDAASGERYHAAQVIRKLGPPPSGIEWRISREGILLRDGEPFLPVGWFSIGASDMAANEGIYNLSWNYWGPWESVAVLRQRLDQIHAAGGYAVIYPTTGNQRPEALTKGALWTEDEITLRERVRALMDHPGLLAWYLADEPEYHNVLPEAVAYLRSVLAEVDPYHPTIVVNNTLGAIRQFSKTADIIAPDPYPFFKQGGDSPAMPKVGTFIAEASAVAGSGQTVWSVPQAHDTRDFGGFAERAPYFLESRNMVWQSVIGGARGIAWWSWPHVNPNVVDSVVGNAYLAREMDALRDFVFEAEAGGFSLAPTDSGAIMVSRRVHDGAEALFIVNTGTTGRKFSLTVPSLGGHRLFLMGEDREVEFASDGTVDVSLDKYGVWLLVSKPIDLEPSLTEVRQTIAEKRKDRFHAGNLAHESTGALITASSRGRYKPGPLWMLDGLRSGRAWEGAKFEGDDTVTILWPETQRLGRVVVYSETVAAADIEILEPGSDVDAWKQVARLEVTGAGEVSEVSFPTTETSQLRFRIRSIRPGFESHKIYEIEAYEN